MVYKVNGTEIYIQPTSGRWLERTKIGFDGNGRPIFSPTRQFEMRWGILDASGTNQLQTWYDGIGATGTSVVELPKYSAPSYVFSEYSGCFVNEPEYNRFFAEHTTSVILLINNIRT